MELFPGEEILVQSNNDKVILTNRRIQLNNKDWGSTYQNTIFLEQISSIENRYASWFMALVGAILSFGAAVMCFMTEGGNAQGMELFIFLGILLLVAWWISRSHVITIKPNGGNALTFRLENIGKDEVDDFLGKVMLAKAAAKRINS